MAHTDIVDMGAARIRRAGIGGHRLTERTYLDRDGKATTDRGRGVTLLGPAGRVIPAEAARLAGLGPKAAHEAAKAAAADADKAGTPDSDKADEPTAAPKRRTARSGDKARKASGDK